MQHWGTTFEGVEYGNAWALRHLETPHTNWLVGDHAGIAAHSLRFLRHAGNPNGGQLVENLALKWFVHDPLHPASWGDGKPISKGHTLSLLAGEGAFELYLWRGDEKLLLLLEDPGDFVVWGAGICHSWRALKPSPVLTLRWQLAVSTEGA